MFYLILLCWVIQEVSNIWRTRTSGFILSHDYLFLFSHQIIFVGPLIWGRTFGNPFHLELESPTRVKCCSQQLCAKIVDFPFLSFKQNFSSEFFSHMSLTKCKCHLAECNLNISHLQYSIVSRLFIDSTLLQLLLKFKASYSQQCLPFHTFVQIQDNSATCHHQWNPQTLNSKTIFFV